MTILNALIVILGLGCALGCFASGTALGFLIMLKPNQDYQDRFWGLIPFGVGSALAILGLALAKWAIWVI